MQVARRLSAALAVVFVAAAVAAPAAAQQFEIMHAFAAPLADAKAPLLPASDGVLYGVYATGGAGGVGAIFAARPAADGSVTVTTAYEFDRSTGGGVVDALVEGPGMWLYGVAPEYGTNGKGAVFKFHPPTGTFVVVHAFSGSDGARPRGALVAADDGNLYGTATAEGPNGAGTIFKLTPEGVFSTLFAFPGAFPPAGFLLQASDGSLYGITDIHTVFRLTLDGTYSIVAELPTVGLFFFGDLPVAFVEGLDGHLYGMMRGALAPLVAFRLTLAGAYTQIHQFDGFEGDVVTSVPLFVAADGSLLGTFPIAGANDRGTLFRLTTSGSVTVLHQFTVAEGSSFSGIVRHANGTYYGTTAQGSVSGHGMLYSVGFGGSIVLRHAFVPVRPYAPSAPPIDGPDGALYGTTIAGGLFNRGAVYRLSASGVTVLHHFFGLDGAYPAGPLVLGPDGLLYGTTYQGGVQDRGTVFRMSPTGAFQTLHAFTTTEGRHPTSGLIRASDGQYWGTTLQGGPGDTGSAFRISPAGGFTTMAWFGSDMQYPYAGLIQAQDGNFYGTTDSAGVSFLGGTIFQLTPAGTLTRLHVFSGPFFGSAPRIRAPLIEASDGQLYGGACCGGTLSGGPDPGDPPQVFRSSLSGVVSTVRAMDGISSAIAEGADLALYGAAFGPDNTTTLFRLERAGAFSELKTLTEADGLFPSGVRRAGEWIMGTTYAGGPGNGGVVYRVKRD